MFKNFKESLRNIKNLRVLCAMALLVALYVAIYMVKLPITNELRVSFTFIPIAISGWLFGAAPAMLVGAIGDILGCVFFPQGAYFPGFTITSMLAGAVMGTCLYKATGWKILAFSAIARAIVVVFLNIGLNSAWLSMLYGNAFLVVMAGRIVKNLLLLPVEVILLFAIIEALSKAGIQKMYKYL